MDLEPELKQAVLRVRDLLRKFADSKGWPPEDYRIFMKFNVDWGNIVVSLVAKAFDPAWTDKNEIYDELLDYLDRELEDDMGLHDSVSLMIYQFQDYVFNIIEQPFENYIDIDERMLNPDVKEIRPVVQVSQRESN